MIAAVRGQVRSCSGNQMVLSVGGVDIVVLVPASTAGRSVPGENVELHTHLSIRPDHVALYGFETSAALEAFALLITVAGVGPKGALGLLSSLDVGELRQAIMEGKSDVLTRAPGIGARVAARIIGELRDKVTFLPFTREDAGIGAMATALDALLRLGYSMGDARRALERDGAHAASAEDLVRSALEFLDSRLS